jgi:transposase
MEERVIQNQTFNEIESQEQIQKTIQENNLFRRARTEEARNIRKQHY